MEKIAKNGFPTKIDLLFIVYNIINYIHYYAVRFWNFCPSEPASSGVCSYV